LGGTSSEAPRKKGCSGTLRRTYDSRSERLWGWPPGGREGRDSGWESRKNSEQSGQAREGYALKGYSVLMPNAFVPSRAEEGDKETRASANAAANPRCDCGVAIVAMRVWIAMALPPLPSPPRSLFSIVQEPTVQSRARRARDSRLERGGSGWRREVEAKSRLQGFSPISDQDQESRISGSCRVQRMPVVANHHLPPGPRLLVAHVVAGVATSGPQSPSRKSEKQRNKQPQSEYGNPCL